MSTEDVATKDSTAESVNYPRRRFLTLSTTVIGTAGTVALTIPMLASMSPSARARAAGAPVEADISKLEPGQMVTYEWRGKPVWIVRRTPEILQSLAELDDVLSDPDSNNDQQPEYARNETRSLKPEILVLIGICTHLGCSPKYRPEIAPADLGSDWKGGFFCPCHGSKFDISGRVYSGVPAPTNLVVPPHSYVAENTILIGVDPMEEGTA
jgi:ubiquinol-cytochrome c reductase iron-sulfur subunit